MTTVSGELATEYIVERGEEGERPLGGGLQIGVCLEFV
jgi:hypothetical protein